jgi:hypothetical protein
MGIDDASTADVRRLFAAPDAEPPPLDLETAERLLAGDLPLDEAPPGYAQVAALLAAMVAAPGPEELKGRAAALAELRAVTRTRPSRARTRLAGRWSRRRRVGLAVVAVTGALATGGAAAAVGGHLPGSVREAARSILVTVGGPESATPAPAPPAPRSTVPGPGGTAALPRGSGPTGQATPSSAPAGAGPVAEPGMEGPCRAYLASQDRRSGKQLDATSFKQLAIEAGGADKILAYCQDLLPEDRKSKEKKQAPPDDQGQGQGQGGPPPGTGGSQDPGGRLGTRSPSR